MKNLLLAIAVLLLSGCGGPQFVQGPKGDPGRDGVGCSVANVLDCLVAPYGGSVVTCGSTSVLITNGAPGKDGVDGADGRDAVPTAYTIVDIIDPCGTKGKFDEVFLVFANGSALASLSDNSSGKNTRLWEIEDGVNLQTTDGTGCVFTLKTVGHTRTISWTGGSKSWNVP